MKKRKTILLFSDLEGTILREADGEYADEDMREFLSQIDKLQDLTGAQVHMHLLSPVYQKQMAVIMRKIDKNIANYNLSHKGKQNVLLPIEGAGAYPEIETMSDEFRGGRIMPLQRAINEKDFDTAQYGKESYARLWYDVYKQKNMTDLIMAIYCGNGRNDLTAMDFINTRKNGFVVCPKNSRKEAKAKAFHVSDKTDLLGISEGIATINKEIEKRENSKQEKNNQEQDEDLDK